MGHRDRGCGGFLMRCFGVLAALCALSGFAAAQTTQVTGTVTDTNSIPYAGARVTAQLIFAGVPASNPTVTVTGVAACRANGFGSSPCQVPFNPNQGPFYLDTNGNVPGGGITLQDNTQVTPASTQWLFSVSTPGTPPPLGTGPQVCSATLTISGASQSITSSFGTCPALGHISSAIQSGPSNPGCSSGQYFLFQNTTTNQLLLCNNGILTTASGSLATVWDATLYGVTTLASGGGPNAYKSCTPAWANSSNTITELAGEPLPPVGAHIWGTDQACQGQLGSTAGILRFTGTVASTNSGTHTIVYTGAATSSACTAGPPYACQMAWYVNDQTTAVTAAFNAMMQNTLDPFNCGKLIFPAGRIPISSAIISGATKCGLTPAANSTSTLMGYEVDGAGGEFGTTFLISDLMNANGCTGGGTLSIVCWFTEPGGGSVYGNSIFRDFKFDGAGYAAPTNAAGKVGLYLGLQAKAFHIGGELWGNNSTFTPLYTIPNVANNGGNEVVENVDFTNFGGNCGTLQGGLFTNYICGNPSGPAIGSAAGNAPVETINSVLGTGTSGGVSCSGPWNSLNDQIGPVGQVYEITVATGCNLHIKHGTYVAFNAVSAVFNGTGTGKVYAQDTNFICQSSGALWNAGSTGFYQDEGGNTYNTCVLTTSTPTCTFTSGGGTSPSCTLQAGSTNEKGVIIASTGTGAPGTTGTITLTFSLSGFQGATGGTPACTYNVDNSGTTWGNEAGTQVSTQSTTAPIVAWYNLVSGTLTALTTSSPYRIDYNCTAR